jgi:7-cyano-7-deazaguanine synthase in queuosine biosynthesis
MAVRDLSEHPTLRDVDCRSELTVSCYGGTHCRECNASKLRDRAFEDAGIEAKEKAR